MRPMLVRLAVVLALGMWGNLAKAQEPTVPAPSGEPLPPRPAPVVEAALAPSTPQPSQPRLWAEVDYLMWWMKPVCQKPVLLSSGNPADLVPGAFGQPGTTLLLGDSRFEFPAASGMRTTVGYWFGDSRTVGLEGNIFALQTVDRGSAYATTGGPATYLPFMNQFNAQSATPFSIPGVIEGVATERGSSRLWGAEANAVFRGWLNRDPQNIFGDLIVGYRYLDLKDQIHLQNQQWLVANPAVGAVGENVFTTQNSFNGGQVGFRLGWTSNRWRVEFTEKLGAGMTTLTSTIQGGPLVAGTQLAPGVLPGPFLAMPSNNGVQQTSRVTVIGEVNLKLSYAVTQRMGLSLGCTLLYWNRIFCPGDMMDPRVNITQLPGFGPKTGINVPATIFARTDYFAQGWEFGLQYRY